MDVQTVRATTLSLFAALLLLTACAPPQPSVRPSPVVDPSDPVAAHLARGELEAAAALLERQAYSATAEDRPQLLLRAAELRLDLEQIGRARALLAQVNEALLSSPARYRKALLEIRLLLADGQVATTESRLTQLAPPAPELRPAWLKVQAGIATATEKPLEAARALVELDTLLPAQQREQNRRAIWTALSGVPLEQLRSLMPPPPDRMGAWLELAYLTRSHRLEPDNLQSALLQWRQRYPDHPAGDSLVGELLAHYRNAARPPERVAVLLPLSGSLSDPGKAILDGFMAAYYADSKTKPQINVYDVGDDPSRALAAYQEAVSAGSDFVVGPLTKESLLFLASAGELPAPLLALNTLPGNEQPLGGMYQFALAPEDEAIAAADYAIAQGLPRALVMVPNGEWGERVAAAFNQALTRRGGTVLETVSYDAQGTDFSTAITALLNLDASNRRGRQLRAALKRDLKIEPQRRQDVDVVFIGAFPRAARLIRPQLRFFDAMDVPVIATSHAYGGFADQADQDLNGVQIVDMPWLLHEGREHIINRKELQQLREQASQQPRLYAFGIDAYWRVRHLPFLRQHPAETMEGYTGVLSLDSQGRVHRRLYPASFRNGVIAPTGNAGAGRSFGFIPDDDATR
jgi:outer membrane PBP1 activator LpoA protein